MLSAPGTSRLLRNSRMMVRFQKMGTQPSKERSILEPRARSKGSHIADG